MTTGKDAATLMLENEAMRNARIEDHRTCEALRRSLTETQDKLRAEVDRSTFLRGRLDAANADVQRLSAMVEELRDRVNTPEMSRLPAPDARCMTEANGYTYCRICGVAWSAHRDDECEKRKAQDVNRATTVKP